MDNPEQITYFGQTDARNRRLTFGIKAKDRTKHVYVIGKTGMGKSTLLENMAVQDIRNGNGFAFIDPHGSAIDTLLEYIPKERINDVVYFAPFDMGHPISFNVMEDVGYDKRHLVVSGLMSTFKKIWQDAWSARMEYILGNTLLALLEYPDATLLEVNKMLADKEFRNKVVANVTDPAVKSFWVDEFAKYTDKFAAEATPAIQNKIGQFTANPLIRNIIGQPKSSFDLREIMDQKKIIFINLSKGRVGESNANLLGSMLITKIYLAALSRADSNKANLEKLPNFYLYVDEFQSFANDSFADILSEARKYKLNLTIAHQYIEQMSDEVRAAVFGNVGTMITFRIGSTDAEVFEKEFAPNFISEDIVNLGFAQVYLRLMIDGIGSQPFSATTLPPLQKQEAAFLDEIITASRQKYTRPREEVEEVIKKLHQSSGGGNNGGVENKNSNKNSGGDFRTFNDKGPSLVVENKSFVKKIEEVGKSRPVISKTNAVKIEKHFETRREEREPRKETRRLPEDHSSLETISLRDLTAKTTPNKPDKKGPSEDNKNSLKEALAGILGDLKATEARPEPKKPHIDIPRKPKEESPRRQHNEIAESELRKLLEL
ncbi:type IV secretory system conjugative DNA transfer family protein [Candidatus Gracilibacteria bacterium]|nr:type IV secretory system conjugative DNA transfer family protein [Candidatus Gracilibacteria bacterium]